MIENQFLKIKKRKETANKTSHEKKYIGSHYSIKT